MLWLTNKGIIHVMVRYCTMINIVHKLYVDFRKKN